ncbi:MAG: TetR/AcrR family transcriptional regulator [Clostridia bacterium]|nr:TetR/AcrR family transcriptional regulator [Clostridia bacterium]
MFSGGVNLDNKEAIIEATIELIEEKGEQIDAITVREICKKAEVGLGLVNYYFESKEKLISYCVEKIINGIVEKFALICEQTNHFTPFEKLEYLGNMTFDFLFDHYTVSKISILSDMHTPKENDNTHRTYAAYLPLISSCRPDWNEDKVKRITYSLITTMQQAFLRNEIILLSQGVNLHNKSERYQFHRQMLQDILGVMQ